MRLDRIPDRLLGPPGQRAAVRLARTLQLDAPTLKLLRRAARDGGAHEMATYAWALGAAPDESQRADLAADWYDAAADAAPGDAAYQYGRGLAFAGGFGRRRSLPLDARRGFSSAADADPDNLAPRLGLVAARFSTGDRETGWTTLDHGLELPSCRYYRSPLAAAMERQHPWLAAPLVLLWPGRTAALLRYVAASLALDAAAAEPGAQAAACARVERLAQRMMAGQTSPWPWLQALSVMMLSLTLRQRILAEPQAEPLREQAAAVVTEFLEQRRALARRYEREGRRLLQLSGGGAAAGLVGALVGLGRSRKRWPPPFPVVWSGRQLLWVGLGVAAGSAALGCLPNPVAAARQRAVEQRLVRDEAGLVTAMRVRLESLLGWPQTTSPGGPSPTGEGPTSDS